MRGALRLLFALSLCLSIARGENCAFDGQRIVTSETSLICKGARPPLAFVGSVMSYNGDSFSVFLFDEENYLAWQADKPSTCLNKDCGTIVSGKRWAFSYSYYASDTYYLIIRCENSLAPCGMMYDVNFAYGYEDERWKAILSWAGLALGILAFACGIAGCVYCGRTSRKIPLDAVPLSTVSEDEESGTQQ
jgi:hypothetical protein